MQWDDKWLNVKLQECKGPLRWEYYSNGICTTRNNKMCYLDDLHALDL